MIAFIHPMQGIFERPAYVQVQATGPSTTPSVAPNAGAAGSSDAATSAAPSTRRATQSANGGQLASKSVPGGTNKAPAQGKAPGSFSAPAKNN